MSEQNPKKMSVTQLTLLTAINMMGSGIVMLPTKLAEIGTISILSWVITAFGSLCLAYAFAKCGMFSKRPGMGGYAEYAFGKAGNFLANYTYGISLLFANIAIALTCVGYGSELLGISLSPVNVCLSTIVVLWICTSANFMGASITGKFSSLAVWCVVLPVLLLSVIGWFWFNPTMYVDSWNPHHHPFFSAVGSSISMTLWAFLGLESACANSDAVENPQKNVPIAVMGATIGVGHYLYCIHQHHRGHRPEYRAGEIQCAVWTDFQLDVQLYDRQVRDIPFDSFLRGFHAGLAIHDRQSVPAIRCGRFLPEVFCES